MRDLKDNIDFAQTLDAKVYTASGTGSAVDLQGYDAAVVVFNAGLWVDGTHTPKVQESDDGTTFTDVGTGDLQGAFTAVSSTALDNVVQRVGYVGAKRYVRGFLTVASATTGAPSAMLVLRGHPARQPLS